MPDPAVAENRSIGTLIVDDQEDVRVLVRLQIERANRELAVIGEAADGDEALRLWEELKPDVIVLDQRMPTMTGLEVAARIRETRPNQPILMFSAYVDDDLTARARELGIGTCLPKGEVHRIPSVIRQLAGAGGGGHEA